MFRRDAKRNCQAPLPENWSDWEQNGNEEYIILELTEMEVTKLRKLEELVLPETILVEALREVELIGERIQQNESIIKHLQRGY